MVSKNSICSVLGCRATQIKYHVEDELMKRYIKSSIQFFKLPTDPEAREKWIDFSQNSRRIKTSRICSLHFRREYVELHLLRRVNIQEFLPELHRPTNPFLPKQPPPGPNDMAVSRGATYTYRPFAEHNEAFMRHLLNTRVDAFKDMVSIFKVGSEIKTTEPKRRERIQVSEDSSQRDSDPEVILPETEMKREASIFEEDLNDPLSSEIIEFMKVEEMEDSEEENPVDPVENPVDPVGNPVDPVEEREFPHDKKLSLYEIITVFETFMPPTWKCFQSADEFLFLREGTTLGKSSMSTMLTIHKRTGIVKLSHGGVNFFRQLGEMHSLVFNKYNRLLVNELTQSDILVFIKILDQKSTNWGGMQTLQVVQDLLGELRQNNHDFTNEQRSRFAFMQEQMSILHESNYTFPSADSISFKLGKHIFLGMDRGDYKKLTGMGILKLPCFYQDFGLNRQNVIAHYEEVKVEKARKELYRMRDLKARATRLIRKKQQVEAISNDEEAPPVRKKRREEKKDQSVVDREDKEIELQEKEPDKNTKHHANAENHGTDWKLLLRVQKELPELQDLFNDEDWSKLSVTDACPELLQKFLKTKNVKDISNMDKGEIARLISSARGQLPRFLQEEKHVKDKEYTQKQGKSLLKRNSRKRNPHSLLRKTHSLRASVTDQECSEVSSKPLDSLEAQHMHNQTIFGPSAGEEHENGGTRVDSALPGSEMQLDSNDLRSTFSAKFESFLRDPSVSSNETSVSSKSHSTIASTSTLAVTGQNVPSKRGRPKGSTRSKVELAPASQKDILSMSTNSKMLKLVPMSLPPKGVKLVPVDPSKVKEVLNLVPTTEGVKE